MDRVLGTGPAVRPVPAHVQDARQASETRPLERWLGFAGLATAWWMALNHIRVEWSINEQYSYGWMVPWLALYLLAVRWKSRPTATLPHFPTLALLLLAVVSLLWLPVRMVQVSSPDWRLIGWALTGLAATVTFGTIYLLGGAAWLRHFWFPVAFMLVAVPWPVPLEQSIIQSLMGIVAGTSVEALRWCGFPALQQGNVISLGAAGVVGFEEACSGVRSMQTMVMTGLFLGEIWHAGLVRRILLLAVGIGVAFAFNVGRAFTLAWLSASHGAAFSSSWHDRIGMLFLMLTLGTFGALAYFTRNKKDDGGERTPIARCGMSRLSCRWGASLLAWLVLVCIATELWYRSGELSGGKKSEIVIQWPEATPTFREIPIPTRTGIILRHDEGRSATWKAEDGDTWSMVYLKWNAGSAAVQLARAHTPDICLPAAGGRLEVDRGVISLPAGDRAIPAHAYTFNAGGRAMHVFYVRAGDDAGSDRLPADIEELTVANRVRAALARRRNRGQQVIELAVTSLSPPEEVTRSVMDFAQKSLRIAELNDG